MQVHGPYGVPRNQSPSSPPIRLRRLPCTTFIIYPSLIHATLITIHQRQTHLSRVSPSARLLLTTAIGQILSRHLTSPRGLRWRKGQGNPKAKLQIRIKLLKFLDHDPS